MKNCFLKQNCHCVVSAGKCFHLDFTSFRCEHRYMRKPVPRISLILHTSFWLIVLADPAWAVQTHGGAEGWVSHQLGHVLFATGMGYLLYRLYRTHVAGPGWAEFKGFLWLIILWNIITFAGHWMDELIDPRKFTTIGGDPVSFTITGWSDSFFYLTRLDHLFLVPSFILLLLALRKWEGHQ